MPPRRPTPHSRILPAVLLMGISAVWPAQLLAQVATTVTIRNKLNAPLMYRSGATGAGTLAPGPAARIAPGASASFRLASTSSEGLTGSVTYETEGVPRGCRVRYAITRLGEQKWQFHNEALAVPRSPSSCTVTSTQADALTGRQSITLTVR